MWPGQPPRKPGFWQRLTPLQRAGLIVAALILPCCGGMTAINALTGDDTKTTTGAGRNLADVQPIQATQTSEPAPETTTEPATEPAPTTETSSSAATTQKTITKKTVTDQAKIPFQTRRVKDNSLAKGKTTVRTAGVNGIKTITYEVTYTDGEQTSRRTVKSVVTRKPVTKVIAVGTKTSSNCDPNYSGCVPVASDVDCAGGSGNGPAYVDGPITVIGTDIYDLDRDGDGIACDS